jgi:hypothetical protein
MNTAFYTSKIIVNVTSLPSVYITDPETDILEHVKALQDEVRAEGEAIVEEVIALVHCRRIE